MTDLEERIRQSLRELVDAYEPRGAPPSVLRASPAGRSVRILTVAAALVGLLTIVAVAVGLTSSSEGRRLETAAPTTTVVTESSSSVPVIETTAATTQVTSVTVAPESSTQPPEVQARSEPLETDSAGSCAFTYTEATLGERAFAFDGTVVSIGESSTSAPFPYVPVEFAVTQWFKGAGPATVVVNMIPPSTATSADQGELGGQWGVGSRLLIAGESQFGAGIHVDPVAWLCGFSRTYDEATASQWATVFASTTE